MKYIAAILLMILAASVSAQSKTDKAKAEIRAVLDAQVVAWNAGDIDGFMRGYWNSPQTTFSGKNLTRGWQPVLDNYKKNYDTPEKRGVLAFNNLEINILSKDSAYVVGEWAIKSATNPSGRFTLVFRKMKDGWRIVHDQTS
jgi:ketosteroid isomerase-like protein